LIVQDLGRLRSRVAVTHKKEKAIYQRMFQQSKQKDEDEIDVDNDEEEDVRLLFLFVVIIYSSSRRWSEPKFGHFFIEQFFFK
jgi:hypothetical protein